MANAAKRMPDVKKMMDKRLVLQLNGHRCIEGTLRGYDQFINLTLADVVDKTVTGTSAASNRDLGMVMVRGNSIIVIEALERASK
ncbi:hypothetical protein I4F81_009072 [Pyropia yezoensis]|uniref:Uncharacterized protein n=1 Tax=Pyropia yezoensis TaxID=2788 RepID=A0ACC3C9X7_PYRYE|nr:hypothetical protein I4F81_009072 [Neopyropia yezoensis]|eukprot:contig_12446_g2972